MTLILTSLLFTLLYQVHPANRAIPGLTIGFVSLATHGAIIGIAFPMGGFRGLSRPQVMTGGTPGRFPSIKIQR